jgi:hypothetical protein
LKAGGTVNIRGTAIGGDVYRSFRGLDVASAKGFAGAALLVQVSAGMEPRRDLTDLSDRLERGGAAVTRAVVSDRSAAILGERHFRPSDDEHLSDVAVELHRKIADVVADWAEARVTIAREGSDG